MKTNLSITLDARVEAKLHTAAETKDLSVSSVIERAVAKYLHCEDLLEAKANMFSDGVLRFLR